jgi:peptide/nickel transport system permease protein
VALSAARRIGSAVIVLWGATTTTFIALHSINGNVVDAVVGLAPVTPQVRAQIAREYALNEPLTRQYLHYLGQLLRGDLGFSYSQNLPVSRVISEQAGPTFALLGCAVAFAIVVGTGAAMSSVHRSRWLTGPVSAGEVVLVAVPAFWLGILLLSLFSFRFHWFPAIGSDTPAGLALPTIALGLAPAAILSRVLRESLESVLDEPFIVTARARGLGISAVLWRHALRHALLPVTTVVGWLLGSFIGGAVVIEAVFSRQGLGQLTVTAVSQRDFPLISAIVLLSTAVYVVANLAVDLIYPALDPRLRSVSRGSGRR